MNSKDIENKIKGLYKNVEPDHNLADDRRILSYEQRGIERKERFLSDEELQKRFTESIKKRTASEEWQKKNKERYDDPKFRDKQRNAVWNNKETLGKAAKTRKATWDNNEELHDKARKNTSKLWQDPEFVKKVTINRTKANKTPEVRAKRRKAEAKKWADPAKKEQILRNSKQATPVQSDGGVFLTIADAAEFHGMSYAMVRERILGIVKKNNYNFKYITWEEYDELKKG